MDLVNALPGNNSVNTAQHATKDEAVFPVDSTDVPIDLLDSDHVTYVSCNPCPFCGIITRAVSCKFRERIGTRSTVE
jgi:hypothetical protein